MNPRAECGSPVTGVSPVSAAGEALGFSAGETGLFRARLRRDGGALLLSRLDDRQLQRPALSGGKRKSAGRQFPLPERKRFR